MSTTTSQSPATLGDALVAWAKHRPHDLALRFIEPGASSLAEATETTLTFSDLNRRATLVASHLALQIAEGERALLLCPPGPDYIAALFGCFYAGLVAVPAYPPMGAGVDDRLTHIFEDCAPRAIVTTEAFLPLIADAGIEALALNAGVTMVILDALTSQEIDREPRCAVAEDLALLQYTSGSTGNPRGVMLSHRNLMANVNAIIAHTDCTPGVDRGVFWLPPYHDMGLIGAIFTPVLAGGETILMSPLSFLADPLLWLEVITRYGGTISAAPNFAYDYCARKANKSRLAELDLSSWRIAINGAEPVRPDTMARFAETFASVGFRPASFMPCYGLAEGTLLVAATPAEIGAKTACLDPDRLSSPSLAHAVSSGVTGPDCEVVIVDPETRRLCKDDDIGEVWVRGPSVAGGYWGRPAESAETFEATPTDDLDRGVFLRTGDLGLMHDGELYITGRLKDVIIVRGQNHYPADIEQTVGDADPRLRKGCVAAFDLQDEGNQRIVVVAELAAAADAATSDEIGRNVSRAISSRHQLTLSELVFIDRGASLKTSSGKIRRVPTREAYLNGVLTRVATYDRRVTGRATSASRDEESIAAVFVSAFEEILGVDAVSVDDDFLALGADSLNAVELAAIAGERGARVDPQDVYRFPTPRRLAQEVVRRNAAGGEAAADRLELTDVLRSEIPRVEDAESYPLSPIQRRWAADYLGDRAKTWGNLSLRFTLEDGGDRAALDAAVKRVWGAHEALRTVFPEEKGELRQCVLEAVAIAITEHDLTQRPTDEQAGAIASIAASDAGTIFDLATGPAARVALVRTSAASAEVIVTLHHMLADGWSLMELREQLRAAYVAEIDETASADISAPRIRYRDYAAWMNGLESRDALTEARRYWLKELDGDLPVTMPVDEEAARGVDTRGASQLVVLPSELSAALTELAIATRYSLSAWLLGAFFLTIQRHTKARDLIIGTPLAGRDRQDIRDVVGMFINLVPIRLRFQREWDLQDVVAATHEKLIGAVTHQRYQLDSMMDDLEIAREPHRFAITNVFFTKIGMGKQAIGSQTGASVAADLPVDVRYQLMLYAYDFADGLVIDWRYRKSVFRACAVEQLLGEYTATLKAAASS